MTESSASPTSMSDGRGLDTLKQLTILYQASLAVGRSRDESEAIQGVVKQLSYGEFDRGLIVLFRERDEPRGEICGHWDRAVNSDQYRAPLSWVESTQLVKESRYFSEGAGNPAAGSFAGEEWAEMGVLAAAVVPMQTHDEVMGVLLLQSRRDRRLSDDFLIPYHALASQIATMLENHRLLSDERQRVEQLNSLVEISKTLDAVGDLHQTYQELTQRTANALGAKRCMVALYNPESREVIGQRPAFGVPNAIVNAFRYTSTASLQSHWHLGQRGPFITNHPETDILPELRDFVQAFGIQSLMVIPMHAEGQVMGMIFVADKDGGFNEQDGQLGTLFANQAAIVTNNARAYQEQVARIREIEILNRISAVSSSSIEINDLLQHTLVELTQIFACESGLVSLWDPHQKTLSLVTQINLPESLITGLTRSGMNDTLCALTALEGKPMIAGDIRNETRVNTEGLVANGFHAYLGAPLVAGGQVLGTICIFGRSLDHFSQENADLIGAVGQQIGLAVRNARRYEEIQERATQIQTAAEVSRAAAAELDPQSLLQSAADLILDRFGYYHVSIFLLDQTREWAVVYASTGEIGRRMIEEPHKLRVGGHSIVGTVTASGKPHIALDTGQDAIHFDNPLLPETRSEMALPLTARGEILGALDVQSREAVAFSDSDIAILQSMADQIAIAQQNANLIADLDVTGGKATERARRLAALLHVFQSVQSSRDLNDQIQAIAEGVIEARLYRRAVVSVLDSNWQITYSGYAGLTEEEIGYLQNAPPLSREERLLRHQERFRISNSFFVPAGQDPLSYDRVVKSHRRAGQFDDWDPDDMLIVPLEIGDMLVGVLSVDDPFDGRRPTEENLIPLELFAGLAARLIENSRLFSDQRDLYQTTNLISKAETMQEIALVSVSQFRKLVGAESAVMFLADRDRHQLSLRVESGSPMDQEVAADYDHIWEGLTGRAMRTNRAMLHHGESDTGTGGTSDQRRNLESFGSLMVIPIGVTQQAVGAIVLANRAVQRRFTQSDLDLLMTVTPHVSASLSNLHLLQDAQRQAVRLQTAANISRATSTAPDLKTLSSDSVELVRKGFGHPNVGLYLVDEAGKWAVLQAATGEVGRQLVAAGHRIRVGDPSPIGQATAKSELQSSQDIGATRTWTSFPHLSEIRSEIALPMITRERVVGALTVQSTEKAAFSEQDTAVLQTTVDLIANAISNLGLLGQLQYSIEEIQRRERRQVRDDWGIQAVARDSEGRSGYEYDLMQIRPSQEGPDSGNGKESPGTLAKPLTLSGEVIGTLGIEADSPDHQWTTDEIAIIDAVAGQVTQAINRAYHSEQSERRAIQLETAARVGKAVASASMLTAAELMNQAVVLVSEHFGFHHTAIYLLNETGDHATLHAASGRAGEVMKASNFTLAIDKSSPVAIAIGDERPHTFSDSDRNRWIPHPLLPETRSQIALPLISAGQTLGAMEIHSNKPAAFDRVYTAVLSTVADQVAAALVNARLFEETRQAAADQQMLFDATTVAVTTADLDTMLLGVAQTIYDRMSCTDVVIMMTDGEVLRRRAGCGMSASGDADRIGETEQINIGEGVIGWVARTGEPLVIGDVLHSPHYLATLPSTQSELAVPITVDHEVVGVINIESDGAHAFDDQDLRLMQTLSGTLGSILKSLQLVEELQDAYREIKEIDRLKSEFLANMSHELRTPLNSIIGFSRVILKGIDGPISPLQEQDLSSIYNSGKHLLGLINNVLDLSKIEAGKMELVPEVVDVKEGLNVVMSTAIGLAKDKDIQLNMAVPPDLPPVWMDPIRLRQVFLNLISNAVKFTEKGSITLQAAADPQAVFVQVIDTGIGISEKDMERLFKSFSQVDSSSTRRAGGSGLGLAISAQLMELQGGRIWVESEIGVGSTFSVALPRVKQTGDGPVTILGISQTESRPDDPAIASEEQVPEKKLLLVIEDEQGVIELYHRYLIDDDFQIVSANTGSDGIDLAVALADQLYAITVDIVMPDMDGWTIIRALREHPGTVNVPIIVCSIVQDHTPAKALGVNQCLVKPILQGDLLDALAECCRASA